MIGKSTPNTWITAHTRIIDANDEQPIKQTLQEPSFFARKVIIIPIEQKPGKCELSLYLCAQEKSWVKKWMPNWFKWVLSLFQDDPKAIGKHIVTEATKYNNINTKIALFKILGRDQYAFDLLQEKFGDHWEVNDDLVLQKDINKMIEKRSQVPYGDPIDGFDYIKFSGNYSYHPKDQKVSIINENDEVNETIVLQEIKINEETPQEQFHRPMNSVEIANKIEEVQTAMLIPSDGLSLQKQGNIRQEIKRLKHDELRDSNIARVIKHRQNMQTNYGSCANLYERLKDLENDAENPFFEDIKNMHHNFQKDVVEMLIYNTQKELMKRLPIEFQNYINESQKTSQEIDVILAEYFNKGQDPRSDKSAKVEVPYNLVGRYFVNDRKELIQKLDDYFEKYVIANNVHSNEEEELKNEFYKLFLSQKEMQELYGTHDDVGSVIENNIQDPEISLKSWQANLQSKNLIVPLIGVLQKGEEAKKAGNFLHGIILTEEEKHDIKITMKEIDEEFCSSMKNCSAYCNRSAFDNAYNAYQKIVNKLGINVIDEFSCYITQGDIQHYASGIYHLLPYQIKQWRKDEAPNLSNYIILGLPKDITYELYYSKLKKFCENEKYSQEKLVIDYFVHGINPIGRFSRSLYKELIVQNNIKDRIIYSDNDNAYLSRKFIAILSQQKSISRFLNGQR